MKNLKKSEYLQIRVSKVQKDLIKLSAQKDGVDMSTWVLQKVLSEKKQQFLSILTQFKTHEESFVFAHLHDFLLGINRYDFTQTFNLKPTVELSDLQINYTIAMICYHAHSLNCQAPQWVNDYPILDEPYFGSNLKSLRLHLLLNSPIAFKQRNIFIDSTIGDRV